MAKTIEELNLEVTKLQDLLSQLVIKFNNYTNGEILHTLPIRLTDEYFRINLENQVMAEKNKCYCYVTGEYNSNDIIPANALILGDDNKLHTFTCSSATYDKNRDLTYFLITLDDGNFPTIKNNNAKYADEYENIQNNLHILNTILWCIYSGMDNDPKMVETYDYNGSGTINVADISYFIANILLLKSDGVTKMDSDYMNDLWLIKYFVPTSLDTYNNIEALIEKGYTFLNALDQCVKIILNEDTTDKELFDINGSGDVNVADITAIVNAKYQFVLANNL